MLDIYFYETFAEEKELLQKYLPPHFQVEFTPQTVQESKHKESPAKLISIRTQSRVPLHWQSAIISRSTGFDHLAEQAKNIPCGYLPHYCNRAVAEQAVVLWMNLLRKIPAQVKHFHTFNRDTLTGRELQGKKVVIFGVGKIGYEIHQLAKALGMEPYGVDIYKNYSDVHYLTPEEGIKNTDIIVCAMNLFVNNKGYFHYDFLKQAKKDTLFVNISRGELSPTKDLLRLLQEEHLGGVALDVFENEDIIAEHLRLGKEEQKKIKTLLELQKHHNVILTPHNSFNTQEAVIRKCQQTIQQIEYFLQNDEFLWKVLR
ncbi:hydroxyacid dehydrogenase [Candidatus Woesearchaeota archaeon]|nr:hydroxyacid dehydrogenase [Candidatus Woesearchaeota archaeon]